MNNRFYNAILLFGCTLFCALLASHLNGQGFIQRYPTADPVQGSPQSVFPQANGSFRLTAVSAHTVDTDFDLFWLTTDAHGQLTHSDTIHVVTPFYAGPNFFLLENGGYVISTLDSNIVHVRYFTPGNHLAWSNSVTFPTFATAHAEAIRANAAGEIFVRGYMWRLDGSTTVDSGFVMKFSAAGALLWKIKHDMDQSYLGSTDFETTPDGGCQFVNSATPNASQQHLLRFASDGSMSWSFQPSNSRLYASRLNALGETLLDTERGNGVVDSSILIRIDPNGQVLQEINLSAKLGITDLGVGLIIPTADSGWVIRLGKYVANQWKPYLLRLDAAGNVRWFKNMFFDEDGYYTSPLTDGEELPDGSFVIYGYYYPGVNNPGKNLLFFRMAADGTIYPHTVTGQVVRDSTFDCLVSPNDPPLPDWIISAEGNGPTRFANTDATGHYTLSDLDTGSYLIKIVPKNYLWEPCVDSVLLTFPDTLVQNDTVNFPIQPLYDCPIMQVDLGTAILRRCLPGTYIANYCNVGNQVADPVNLAITLDPLFLVDSASMPYTQSGSVFSFTLGAIAPGDCGSVRIYGTLSCDAELGQTLCADAHISPDTICASDLPNWSGAAVEVTAHCAGDSVQFSIHNTGHGANANTLDFIVIDDHVITRQGHFSLPAGDSHSEAVPADGSTWRIVAEQEPGYPFGQQMPSVAVEGCNLNGGSFSMGMLNLFPNYSGDPFNDRECKTVVGAYDPNDKQAFPIGVDNQHFIEQNQSIDYQIRFQNTGTDTAFTVVIKDTLSAWLDPATIRPGASSHPYTWTLSGTGVLAVTFEHILLPDSNINEVASHGFVQFHIDQRLNNPLGSVVTNRAGIYFDFNAPVMTNTVWHTIGHDFLTVATSATGEPRSTALPLLAVWPNPAKQRTTVWPNRAFEPGQRLVLRDAFGRVVQEQAVQGSSVELQQAKLPAGLYFLELRDAKRVLGLGKVIWSN